MCLWRGPELQLCSGFPVQLGPLISGAAKAVIRTSLCFCRCCPHEQHSGSGPRWTTKTDLHPMDAMNSEAGRETWANKWFILLYCIFYTYLCASNRWLISNCLVSFSAIKFSLSPMLTTLGSSSPVVQMGESSSGTWMLRGRR